LDNKVFDIIDARCNHEGYIQIDLKDVGLEGTEWVLMAWGRNWNMVTEFQIL